MGWIVPLRIKIYLNAESKSWNVKTGLLFSSVPESGGTLWDPEKHFYI